MVCLALAAPATALACEGDDGCKGDRICEQGVCVTPPAPQVGPAQPGLAAAPELAAATALPMGMSSQRVEEPRLAILITGVALAGTGAIAGVVGAAVLAQAIDARNEASDKCQRLEEDLGVRCSVRDSLSAEPAVLGIEVGLSSTLLVAGVVMLIAGAIDYPHDELVTVMPQLGMDGGGATVQWRF
jgi:hypothetical protein